MNNYIEFTPGIYKAEWLKKVIYNLRDSFHKRTWEILLEETIKVNSMNLSIHLGVFVEPYLNYILEGKKTVESRFSINKCAPYNKVNSGDVILLKKSGGPIVAIARIAKAWSYNLDINSWKEIKTDFINELCIQDPNFWEIKKNATYATLMTLEYVQEIAPIEFKKRDRRGWLILNDVSKKKQLKIDGIT